MAPQASKKCGLLPPDHQQIGSWSSNGIDSEQGSRKVLLIRRAEGGGWFA
jgi:hypothetical protein